jgi:hypothetical protein
MRKIWTNIKDFWHRAAGWWVFKFRNTIVEEVELDAFIVTFRRFTMDIATKSGNVKLRTTMMQYPQAFLLHCLSKGDTSIIHWFCRELYQFVSLVTTDQGLADDIHKAFSKYDKRMNKKAKVDAKNVTEEDNKMDEDTLNANLAYNKMSKEDLKEHFSTIKDILTQEE